MTKYPWKRFWCPRDGHFSLGDGGYLSDPDDKYGAMLHPDVDQLASFANAQCLVMLGEPGIGKTTEFDAEVQSVQAQENDGNRTMRVDLNEYQTDARLIDDAFQGETNREWAVGSQTLHMFFDSLDEGRLEIKNVAKILASQLRAVADKAARLRLRLTCRTAEWPSSLEQALQEVFGEENVSVIELVPLRRMDVVAAATAEGLNSKAFLSEIETKAVVPFAINPITLKLLISFYSQSAALPSTKQELYEQGCLELCKEKNQSRHDAGHRGQLSALQRLEVASRIAAYTVFTGRSIVETGTEYGHDSDLISVAQLAGGWESVRIDRFDVTEQCVREVLGTSLFSGRGPERLGFAHRTFAEFLAARYIEQRKLDNTQTGSLIFHAEHGARVVPQLAETAGWVALSNNHIFERMMLGDPQTLLRSDVTTTDDVKEQLVDRLMKGLQSEELDDSDTGLWSHYDRLSHPRLAEQLEPVLLDKGQNKVTRRVIADIAERCNERGLLTALKTVALDASDDPPIRAQASHEIVRIDDKDAIESLKPLAFGQGGDDPDDDLRGNALSGLWKHRLISAENLFETLSPPRQRSYWGAYRLFLSKELPQSLRAKDIAVGLRWCREHPGERSRHDVFDELRVALVGQAFAHLDDSEILDALTDYAASCFAKHEELPRSAKENSSLPQTIRHRLLRSLVPKISVEKHGWRIVRSSVPLCVCEDLEWVLEQSAAAATPDEQRQWAQLALMVSQKGVHSDIDTVLAYYKENASLREVFGQVVLDWERAEELRKTHERILELEQRSQESQDAPLPDPLQAQRVQDFLAVCEAGDLTGWWKLNRALQLEPRSTHYSEDLDFKDDLTELAGWRDADEPTRERIVDAARRCLTAWQSDSENWLGSNTIRLSDYFGYRALVLVEQFDPHFLNALTAERWESIAALAIGFSVSHLDGPEAGSRQRQLVALAYQRAPDAVIAALGQLIDGENSREICMLSSCLERVKECRDDRMLDRLLAKAQDGSLKPACVGELLAELVRRGSVDAMNWANSLIVDRTSESAGALADESAAVLWRYAEGRGWDVLWPEFNSDRAFFRSVMSTIAHKRGDDRQPPARLTEEQLADLYIRLSEEFPQAEDRDHDGAFHPDSRDSVQQYRDGILSKLQEFGTPEAVAAVDRIRQALPHLAFLGWVLRAAKRAMLEATWMPPTVEQLQALTERPASRLVRSGAELQQVIIESLERLQKLLHGETPAVRDLWDKRNTNIWRPVDENALSDYVKRHLEQDLTTRGIVALREVEIRRGNGGSGERTDIYVIAQVAGPTPDSHETVRVIVEVKGCWHRQLKTAMETQLKDRYLQDHKCSHGIYVVGWFSCDAWDDRDHQKRATPRWDARRAWDHFAEQAEILSGSACALRSFVLDTSLR